MCGYSTSGERTLFIVSLSYPYSIPYHFFNKGYMGDAVFILKENHVPRA
jgi:hypothetical protein